MKVDGVTESVRNPLFITKRTAVLAKAEHKEAERGRNSLSALDTGLFKKSTCQTDQIKIILK